MSQVQAASHGVFHFSEPVVLDELTKHLHEPIRHSTLQPGAQPSVDGSVVHMYKFLSAIEEPIRLPIVELAPEACYLLLHTHGDVILPADSLASGTEMISDSIASLTKLGFNATLTCVDRSLANRVSNGSCHNIYLWTGKKASNGVRSAAMAKAFQLGTALASLDSDNTKDTVHSRISSLGTCRPFVVASDGRKLGSSQASKLIKQIHLLFTIETLGTGKKPQTAMRSLNFKSPRVGTLSRNDFEAIRKVKDDSSDANNSARSGVSSTSSSTTTSRSTARSTTVAAKRAPLSTGGVSGRVSSGSTGSNGDDKSSTLSPSSRRSPRVSGGKKEVQLGSAGAHASTLHPKQVEPAVTRQQPSAPFRSRGLVGDRTTSNQTIGFSRTYARPTTPTAPAPPTKGPASKTTPSTVTPTSSTTNLRKSGVSATPRSTARQEKSSPASNGNSDAVFARPRTSIKIVPPSTSAALSSGPSSVRSSQATGRTSSSEGLKTPKSPALNLDRLHVTKSTEKTSPSRSVSPSRLPPSPNSSGTAQAPYTSEKSARQIRRQQLAESSHKCDQITESMYLSGDDVAKDRSMLEEVGITHVLNVAGPNCANYFPDVFTYRTIFLSDNSTCDIESTFYDIVDFIDEATNNSGGKVLVHCFQGVSRSASAVICYLMLANGWTFEQSLRLVVSQRPIAKPNPYFTHQLIAFQERLKEGVTHARLYEIAPQSEMDPSYLVPRAVRNPTVAASKALKTVSSISLVFDTCFVLQCPDGTLYLWIGSGTDQDRLDRAEKHVDKLMQYEHGARVVRVEEGQETDEFWSHFDDRGKHYDPKARSQKKETTPSLQPTIENFSNDEGAATGRQTVEMWEWPACENMGLFDTDDLADEGVFVVFDRDEERAGTVFVWVGAQSELAGKPRSELEAAGMDVLEKADLSYSVEPSKIHVLFQGEEDSSAEFWDLFQ